MSEPKLPTFSKPVGNIYIALAIGMLVCVLGMIGCGDKDQVQKFHEGDLVVMKIDGRPAMVLDSPDCGRASHCNYTVRVLSGAMRTDTHLLQNDGPLRASPYELLMVYDYELRSINKQ